MNFCCESTEVYYNPMWVPVFMCLFRNFYRYFIEIVFTYNWIVSSVYPIETMKMDLRKRI